MRKTLFLTCVIALLLVGVSYGQSYSGGVGFCPNGNTVYETLIVSEPYLNSPGDRAVGVLRIQNGGGGSGPQTYTATISIYAPGSTVAAATNSRTFTLTRNLESVNVALE